MNKLVTALFVVLLICGCSQKKKGKVLFGPESDPFIRVAGSDEEWAENYPEDFPFISGGTPLHMNMNLFSQKLKDLNPVLFLYEISLEELRDLMKEGLEKYEWEYSMEEDHNPTHVYRFYTNRNGSRVMASVMNLEGLTVLQVVDVTRKK